MADAPQTPVVKAGRSPRLVIWFIAIAATVLAADLLSKWLAFEHVAGRSISLSRRADNGATLVQARDDQGRLIPQPDLHYDDINENGMYDPGEPIDTLGPPRYTGPAGAIPKHPGVTVVPYVLKLKLTINTGAVFGIGKGKQWFFVVISVLAILVISYFFYRHPAEDRLFQVTMALILGGALGNLYDRVQFNGVRDLLHLFPDVKLPFGLTWPGGSDELYPWIFNIADAALVIGVLLLLAHTWFGSRNRQAKVDPATTAKKG